MKEETLAGVEGVEPPVAVLETAGLPLTDTPNKTIILYFSFSRSLCSVLFRQCLQYLIRPNFPSVFNLFFVVT